MELQYGSKDYWDVRYKQQEGNTFDWLESYESLRDLILKTLRIKVQPEVMTASEMNAIIFKAAVKLTILNLGCGNSTLTEEMYDQDSFKYTINVDISSIVIQ